MRRRRQVAQITDGPTINGISPATSSGTENVEGRITGSNLSGVTAVDMGYGVVVKQFSSLGASEIYIYFSVLRDAPPGSRTVNVVTTAGVAQSTNGFTVGDNSQPQARFTVNPPVGYKSTVFKFDGSGSNDYDGNITNYQWSFSDGSNPNGKIVNYQFDRAGSLKARLARNRQSWRHQYGRAPHGSRTQPRAHCTIYCFSFFRNTNTTFHFDATSSRDPDGQIRQYTWNFGDGHSANGMKVEHKYTSDNNFNASLTVSDNTGQRAGSTRLVHVERIDNGGDDDDDDDDEWRRRKLRSQQLLYQLLQRRELFWKHHHRESILSELPGTSR